jgi:hypothetical protein
MNDIDLCEQMLRIRRYAETLQELERDNRRIALEKALDVIETAAREGRRTLRKLCASP